jgi:hypothetical protein
MRVGNDAKSSQAFSIEKRTRRGACFETAPSVPPQHERATMMAAVSKRVAVREALSGYSAPDRAAADVAICFA